MSEFIVRRATLADVEGMHRLINHFAGEGLMLPKSRNNLYQNIRDFTVAEQKGELVGCCALHVLWNDLGEIRSLAVGTKVEIAATAIAKASVAIPPIRALLKKFPDDFIYGASAPDIILGKKLAGYLHHCHNWRMGWLILNEGLGVRALIGC